MSVDDVWRRIDRHLGVYINGTFDEVPKSPGVYAWFYPLKIPSLQLDDLLDELRSIFNYDAIIEETGQINTAIDLNWESILLDVKKHAKLKGIPEGIYDEWEQLSVKHDDFIKFRKALMSASLLMPPLYVGKASVLRDRCSQHLLGTYDNSGFKKRFEIFAESNNITTKAIEDLIFVCIQTDYKSICDEKNSNNRGSDNPQSLLEEILKIAAKPPYGVR